MHKRFVFNIMARILLVSCFFMLFPLGWALFDGGHSLESVAFEKTISFGLCISVLILFLFRVKKEDYRRVTAKDGLAIVGLSWVVLSAFGALPLYLSGTTAHFTDAFFEIVSGFTTTGATIFTDVEALPRGILFWRSLTHWLGGMGIIVLYIALLPALGSNTAQLYKAEAPGLTVEKVDPRLKETAKNLWSIYFLLSLTETIALMFGGMTLFDALCHTFGTMATGGFSTKNASMAAYSPMLQWIVIVFMIFAGINFVLHYQLLRGRPRAFIKNEEFRYYIGIICIATAGISFVLFHQSISVAPIRDAAFQVVAILTTTGFVTADFDLWPNALRFLLVALMFVGGCGGSTGGGLKLIRVILSFKIAWRSIVQSVFPNMVSPIRSSGKALSEKIVLGVLSYFVIFIFLLFLGTAVLAITESCNLVTAFTASLSALSNIGPGLADVGATKNFAWMSLYGKWLLVFLMLAGRLELYAILILFLPSTWRK